MIIAYLYQFKDGSFYTVQMKVNMNKYLKQAEHVINNSELVVGRWTIKKKS
jgi:hypothetical protein